MSEYRPKILEEFHEPLYKQKQKIDELRAPEAAVDQKLEVHEKVSQSANQDLNSLQVNHWPRGMVNRRSIDTLHFPEQFQKNQMHLQHHGPYTNMPHANPHYNPHAFVQTHFGNPAHFESGAHFQKTALGAASGPSVIDKFVDWLASKLESLLGGKKGKSKASGRRPGRLTNAQITAKRAEQLK